MKNITKNRIFLILIGATLLTTSCKKSYIVGGNKSGNAYLNSSNYDALAAMPQFDTLVQLIDAAGLKENINEAGTIFAPTNRSVLTYLNQRTLYLQNTVDLSKKFLLDSLSYYLQNNINGTKDSLKMYLLNEKLTPDMLTEEGSVYQTGLANDNARISFEETTDGNSGYTDLISTVPRLLYYAQSWDGSQEEDESDKVLVKTAFIKTKTGIINALEAGHVLFFYGR